MLPDVIEEGLDVFINEDHQDQTGEGSAHRPPQDQPKLLTALKGIFFRKQIFGRYISVLLNCLNYILK